MASASRSICLTKFRLAASRRTRRALYRGQVRAAVNQLFFTDLIDRTKQFNDVTWLGQPVWQNILDLWTIQETIAQVAPGLLIETGTHRGGSAWFYAQLFDLMKHGRIVTIDVEKMHEVSHPRIDFLIGSSTAPGIVDRVRAAVDETDGPVMVILDSDHSQQHVAGELESYAQFVTPGSYVLVQDGCLDTLPVFRPWRPGPLPAIHEFISRHPEFEIDRARSQRFLISHHPDGWLRRRAATDAQV